MSSFSLRSSLFQFGFFDQTTHTVAESRGHGEGPEHQTNQGTSANETKEQTHRFLNYVFILVFDPIMSENLARDDLVIISLLSASEKVKVTKPDS